MHGQHNIKTTIQVVTKDSNLNKNDFKSMALG